MNADRIKELRQQLENECISTEELLEIDYAFAEIPDSFLRDQRENAMASDMLDEIEQWENYIPAGEIQFTNVTINLSNCHDPKHGYRMLCELFEQAAVAGAVVEYMTDTFDYYPKGTTDDPDCIIGESTTTLWPETKEERDARYYDEH